MRLDSPKVKRAAGWIGAFALPVAIVQVAGWMSGSTGPAQAGATDVAQHAPSHAEEALQRIAIDEGARKRLSPIELAAAQRIDRLRIEPFGPTPMLHALTAGSDAQAQATIVLDPRDDTPIINEPIPSFHLQAVMSSNERSAARVLINGVVCAIGETVAGTDWVIAEVNADTRRVVIEHVATNRSVALTLQTPN